MKYALHFLAGAIAAAGFIALGQTTGPRVLWVALGLWVVLFSWSRRRRYKGGRIHYRRRPGLPRPRPLRPRREPQELGRNRHQHPPRPQAAKDIESALRNFGARPADARKAAAAVPEGLSFDEGFRMALAGIPGRKVAR